MYHLEKTIIYDFFNNISVQNPDKFSFFSQYLMFDYLVIDVKCNI